MELSAAIDRLSDEGYQVLWKAVYDRLYGLLSDGVEDRLASEVADSIADYVAGCLMKEFQEAVRCASRWMADVRCSTQESTSVMGTSSDASYLDIQPNG